jgi:hypothetical protein
MLFGRGDGVGHPLAQELADGADGLGRGERIGGALSSAGGAQGRLCLPKRECFTSEPSYNDFANQKGKYHDPAPSRLHNPVRSVTFLPRTILTLKRNIDSQVFPLTDMLAARTVR